MPDPICPGGSQVQAGVTALGVYATEQQIRDSLGGFYDILLPFFVYGPRPFYVVEDLCASTPAPGPDLDAITTLEVLQRDPDAIFEAVTWAQERIKWTLWNDYCECAATPLAPGADCYDATALALNPVLFHKLNEASGTTANDYGSANQDAAMVGAYSWGHSGPFSGRTAARFTTGAPQGAAQVRSWQPTGVGRVALSAWIHPVTYHTSPSNLQVIQTYQTGTASGALLMQLRIQASNATTGTLRGVQARVAGLSTEVVGPSIALNAWTHVVFSYDLDGFLRMYVNGALTNTVSANQSSNGPTDAGAFYDVSQSSTVYFDGYVYGAMVTTPLSSTQVGALYASALTSCDEDAPAQPIDEPTAPTVPTGIPTPPALECDVDDLCAAVNQIRLELAAVKELALVTQRQAAPFGYQLDETWVASGSGTRTVRGLIALAVDPTTIPVYKGQRGSAVKDYFELGFVAQGTADGWVERTVIRHDPQLLHIRGDSTRIGWDLAGGVAVTFKSYRRLM